MTDKKRQDAILKILHYIQNGGDHPAVIEENVVHKPRKFGWVKEEPTIEIKT